MTEDSESQPRRYPDKRPFSDSIDHGDELALPKYWSELDPEDQSLYLHRNLSKDDLFEAIVREADLHEKDTTGSYPFKKHHLVDLLLELRARQ
jgi:hypothetical protein